VSQASGPKLHQYVGSLCRKYGISGEEKENLITMLATCTLEANQAGKEDERTRLRRLNWQEVAHGKADDAALQFYEESRVGGEKAWLSSLIFDAARATIEAILPRKEEEAK
jgi:hypothetical protein